VGRLQRFQDTATDDIYLKHNILETKDPPLLYGNVVNTMQKYRAAWGEPNAPVWFLNDADCLSAIHAAKPALLNYYDTEVHGSWKADICRVAALYLTGGYSFGVDMEVVQPWKHDESITFATTVANSTKQFVQSFVQVKRGRILRKQCRKCFFTTRRSRAGHQGPSTMKWAFDLVPISDRGETLLLEEDSVGTRWTRWKARGCRCLLRFGGTRSED
jgi:hypothetical protein